MENTLPLISVVVPVYKVEKFLKDSINSLLNQTYENIEIILVDDGSPDKCPEICDEFAQMYHNVSVIHKENGGLSDARNHGLDKCNGKYVLFLDSDDTLNVDSIEQMVNIAIEDDADIVIPDRYFKVYENSEKKELCYHFGKDEYIENSVEFAANVLIGKGRAWRASSVLYKNEILQGNFCRFPIGYISEDVFFNLDVMKKAQKISFCKIPTLNNLKRRESITATFCEDYFETILKIDQKAFEFFQVTNYGEVIAMRKRNSLLMRNVITYLFGVYSKKNQVSSKKRRELFCEIVNDERVRSAVNTRIEKPFFNYKFLGDVYLLINFLLRYRLNLFSIGIIKLINFMR